MNKAVDLALARHPASLVAPGVCYGRLDVPPGPDTTGLFAAMCAFGPACVWTSPARRCREIAERCAAVLGVALRVDGRLAELDFGDWEGRRWDALPRDALDAWAADPLGFAAPGGESGAALVARVGACLAAIDGEGRAAAVVSHGGPLRVLSAVARGEPVDLLRPAPVLGSVEVVRRASPRAP